MTLSRISILDDAARIFTNICILYHLRLGLLALEEEEGYSATWTGAMANHWKRS